MAVNSSRTQGRTRVSAAGGPLRTPAPEPREQAPADVATDVAAGIPAPAPADLGRPPRTVGWAGWDDRLLAWVSSPWRRWVSVLIVGAIVGGIPATSASAIYLFGFVIVDVVCTGCWKLMRWIVAGFKGRKRRRGRR